MSTIADTQCAFESGRAFGKTATAFRAATGQRMRMNKAPKTYTIHRGTVRSAFTLYHHVMPIYARHERANDALGKATAAVIESESEERRIKSISGWDAEKVLMLAHAERLTAERGTILRSAQVELKNATARADEASKMHLVPFVAPYVPAKASRVFPALKTCTSPRRAAIARQRALFAASIGTPEQARASGFKWYETDIKNAKITIDGHEITGAYTETSLGYTAR